MLREVRIMVTCRGSGKGICGVETVPYINLSSDFTGIYR